MTKQQWFSAVLLVAAAMLATTLACEDDDHGDDPTADAGSNDELAGMGPYAVIVTAGESSRFLGIIPSLDIGTFTLDKAIESEGFVFFVQNRRLFVMPGPAAGAEVAEVYDIQGDILVPAGNIDAPPGAFPTDILFVDATTAYLTLMNLGRVWRINPTTLEKTGEVDLSMYAIDDDDPETPPDATPEPTSMAIKDGKLYVVLSQSYNNMMMARDGVHVAVIDPVTLTVEKVIAETNRGFAYGGRMGSTGTSTFVDERGDLYISAIASWGWVPGQKAGFLRIRAGETEFDPTWEIDLSQHPLVLDGESATGSYINFSVYAGNGIVYGSLHIPALESDPVDWVNDRMMRMVKVDLYNRTVEPLPVPATSMYANALTVEGGKLVVPLFTDAGDGIYVYDPATGVPATQPVMVSHGSIGYIGKIE